MPSRRRVAALFAGAVLLAPASAKAAGTRLQGTFTMAGHVTVAVRIRGEHAGMPITRTWTFTPLCPAGACQRVRLVRQRANGSDSLVLRRRHPGRYVGHGTFFVPLRCGGRVRPHGEAVPFTIRVRITGSTGPPGASSATAISATYVNRRRINHTVCVAIPGHDSARYTGQLNALP